MYCRRHQEHHARHGSFTKKSYTAAQLDPFRNAARGWLADHKADREVVLAIEGVRGLYRRAGAFVEAFRLRGLTPDQRARAAWARLREAKVDPVEPLVAWLAVELAVANDPQPERKTEFKRVQAAKAVHRMASGSHRRWEREQRDGTIRVEEMHVYPHSRGRVLRHLGEQLENAVGIVIDPAMRDLMPTRR
jgi:hypothetical protein